MNLKHVMASALDGAFLRLARIGPADSKKGNAILALAAWVTFFLLGIFFCIDFWIYPIHDLYLQWWPYRANNFRSPKSTGFALMVTLMAIGGWIAYRVSKRCSHLIDYSETTAKEWVFFSVWMLFVVLGTVILAASKYGAVIVVLTHLTAFYLASKRYIR